MASKLAGAGATVQTERRIPELYEKTDQGQWREAVMDVTVNWPLSAATRLLDVTLRSAHSQSVGNSAGAASRRALYDKKQRYGERVEPLVVELHFFLTLQYLFHIS